MVRVMNSFGIMVMVGIRVYIVHIAMCLRVLRSRATASERALVIGYRAMVYVKPFCSAAKP